MRYALGSIGVIVVILLDFAVTKVCDALLSPINDPFKYLIVALVAVLLGIGNILAMKSIIRNFFD